MKRTLWILVFPAALACGSGTGAADDGLSTDAPPDATTGDAEDPGPEVPPLPDEGSWDIGREASAPATLTPDPAVLDLGDFGPTCEGPWKQACFRNRDDTAVTLDALDLPDCPPTFRLEYPALPVTVPPGGSFCVDVRYVPQALGTQACLVAARVTPPPDQPPYVILVGRGLLGEEVVDTFHQVQGQEVDVLFAIDDSPSMCPYQERLRQNFDRFVQNAEVWKNDAHLGVISLEALDDAVAGRLNRGADVAPLYLTHQDGASFVDRAMLGCAGTADDEEQGLEAVHQAVRLGSTGTACDDDAECAWRLCDEAPDCPWTCREKVCAGFNDGFLRHQAQLEVVVISDTDDRSPATVAFYVDFLKSIKGYYNTNMIHVNAIAMPPEGCGVPTSVDSLQTLRYGQVVTAMNGRIGSICEAWWDGVLSQGIGKVVFTPKVQFFLSRLADPEGIEVEVDGEPCATPEGWRYDAPSNSIIFKADGPCVPVDGQDITVRYHALRC